MVLTKQEVMAELHTFMCGFANSIARLYTPRIVPAMLGLSEAEGNALGHDITDSAHLEDTSLWKTVSEMYDFGIASLPQPGYGCGPLDGSAADSELFMTVLGNTWMHCYLAEDDVSVPTKVIRTVETAVARHVLEGGERYIDHDAGEGNGPSTDMLTIREVALLANMDERSVRNASNPKNPSALKTVQAGKRTLVRPADAKIWLTGRKGYIPLREATPLAAPSEPEVAQLQLPKVLMDRMASAAQSKGQSIEALLSQLLT